MDASFENSVLETATRAGIIQLRSGAEIFRVEDTINRICRHFNVNSDSAYVLSNGIFVTAGDENRGYFAKVKHVPVCGIHLGRVAEVENLLFDMEKDNYTVSQVNVRLNAIDEMQMPSRTVQTFASGIGSAAFCLLFGGSFADAAVSFAAGFLLYIFWLGKFAKRMSKIVLNITGAMFVTFICVMLHRLGFGDSFQYMIIGSIIPMIPGVAFTNGIRDIAFGDYISGEVRMMDAILIFMCIALGVGVVHSIL